MSQNSDAKPWLHRVSSGAGYTLWVLLSLFGFTAAIIVVWLQFLPDSIVNYLTETTPGLLFMTALQWVITLAIVVGIPLLIQRRTQREMKSLPSVLGIAAALKPKHALIVPLVWFGYFIATTLAAMIASYVPGFDLHQTQDIGFDNLTNTPDLVLGFIGLVVLAPLAEELVFRGYLFGKLRNLGGFWPTAIVVSLVFAIAHRQWNVGLDVFVLSMFLCWLRERTGIVWAGVLLHGLKNSIAYFLLFIAPLLGLKLL